MALLLPLALWPAASVPSAGDQLACATTCSDPALCGSLRPQPDPHRFEVVAPLVGGVRDLWQYGQNGSEWQNWLLSNTETVTTIPVMNSVRPLQPHPTPGPPVVSPWLTSRRLQVEFGFSSGASQGMLCAAHKHNIRVVDWDIAGGMSAANPLDPNRPAHHLATADISRTRSPTTRARSPTARR